MHKQVQAQVASNSKNNATRRLIRKHAHMCICQHTHTHIQIYALADNCYTLLFICLSVKHCLFPLFIYCFCFLLLGMAFVFQFRCLKHTFFIILTHFTAFLALSLLFKLLDCRMQTCRILRCFGHTWRMSNQIAIGS